MICRRCRKVKDELDFDVILSQVRADYLDAVCKACRQAAGECCRGCGAVVLHGLRDGYCGGCAKDRGRRAEAKRERAGA